MKKQTRGLCSVWWDWKTKPNQNTKSYRADRSSDFHSRQRLSINQKLFSLMSPLQDSTRRRAEIFGDWFAKYVIKGPRLSLPHITWMKPKACATALPSLTAAVLSP